MSRTNMAEILEICLQRVRAGRTIDEAIADYPAQAEDLRALLQISLDALPRTSEMGISSRAQLDSKKRFLAQAEQIQQRPGAAFLWRLVHFFRGNAGQIAFGLAALAMLFVALGSAGALPGDGLYPIKLAAEQAEVNLASNPASRITLEASYDNRRAEEVAQMIREGRTGTVSFGGYLSINSQNDLRVAGISLITGQAVGQQARNLLDVYVEVTGQLGLDGRVTVDKLEPRLQTLMGTVQQMNVGLWQVDGKTVKITDASRITGTPDLGSRVILQTAALKDSQQVLAISGEVIANTPTVARPSKTPQPSVTPTITRTATVPPARTPVVTDDNDHESEGTHEPKDEGDDGESHDGGDDDNSGSDDDHDDDSGGGDDDKDGEGHSGSGG